MAAAKKSSRKKTPRKSAPKGAAAKRKTAAKAAAKGAGKAPAKKPAGTAKTAAGTAKKAAGTAKTAAGTAKRAAGSGKRSSAGKAAGTAKQAASAAASPVAAYAGPKVGDAAPDFKLLDDAGRTQSLGNFRGRKVVLYFYPKDFTGGCTQEACDFRDNFARIAGKGAVVLGVSADSVDSHRRFKEKQGINYLLLSDPGHEAIGSYGVWQEKSLYGRKFMGIVRSTFLIDEEGRLAKVFPKVKVGGHVDEVLAAL